MHWESCDNLRYKKQLLVPQNNCWVKQHLLAVDTIGNFKIILSIKPYLVTSNGERLIVYNIVRNGFLWIDLVFEKEVIFREFGFQDLRSRIWGLDIKHLKAHNVFHYYLATSKTNWAQIFIGLLFYAYVEIHQVRRLVFDIYNSVQCL